MRFSELFQASLKDYPESDNQLEIELLIEAAFALDRTQYWLLRDEPISDSRGLARYQRYFRRLIGGEPIAYILGEVEFFKTSYYVNRHVLIPRPETELLVEKALEIEPAPDLILDIGAGCGNISISLAIKTGATVTALEKSRYAISVLKKNVLRHGLSEKVIPYRGDLFPAQVTPFDLIVSNPPYLSEAEWLGLPNRLKRYEPAQAFRGGDDGLDIIRRIIESAPSHLKKPGGLLMLEIGFGQASRVENILASAGFHSISIYDDLKEIPRVIKAGL